MELKTPGGDSVSLIVSSLRKNFDEGITRDLAFRFQQLDGIGRFLLDCEQAIYEAIQRDLGRAPCEALIGDIFLPLQELKYTKENLSKWAKPEKAPSPLAMQPAFSKVYKEPRGVVLIFGTWNFPITLTLTPLIGAIAAGNCIILKCSEVASHSSRLLASRLPQYIDRRCLQIMEGDASLATSLLRERFDAIFYTGNKRVGRIILEAAAKHLTPVTLELGGKCPCIIDNNTDIKTTARRIVFGKFVNAGQICVAPDYLLVHESIETELLFQIKKALEEFYGNDPMLSSSFSRIINQHNFQRLLPFLTENGDIVVGGKVDQETCYIAPTVLKNVRKDAPIMQEEVFGPILPVIRVKDIDEAIAFVNTKEKPLALYLFTESSTVREKVINNTSSGGVGINCIGFHSVSSTLPFGGVGASGMGSYHGKATFDFFSHHKSVMLHPIKFDLKIFYPPYTITKFKWIRRLLLMLYRPNLNRKNN